MINTQNTKVTSFNFFLNAASCTLPAVTLALAENITLIEPTGVGLLLSAGLNTLTLSTTDKLLDKTDVQSKFLRIAAIVTALAISTIAFPFTLAATASTTIAALSLKVALSLGVIQLALKASSHAALYLTAPSPLPEPPTIPTPIAKKDPAPITSPVKEEIQAQEIEPQKAPINWKKVAAYSAIALAAIGTCALIYLKLPTSAPIAPPASPKLPPLLLTPSNLPIQPQTLANTTRAPLPISLISPLQKGLEHFPTENLSLIELPTTISEEKNIVPIALNYISNFAALVTAAASTYFFFRQENALEHNAPPSPQLAPCPPIALQQRRLPTQSTKNSKRREKEIVPTGLQNDPTAFLSQAELDSNVRKQHSLPESRGKSLAQPIAASSPPASWQPPQQVKTVTLVNTKDTKSEPKQTASTKTHVNTDSQAIALIQPALTQPASLSHSTATTELAPKQEVLPAIPEGKREIEEGVEIISNSPSKANNQAEELSKQQGIDRTHITITKLLTPNEQLSNEDIDQYVKYLQTLYDFEYTKRQINFHEITKLTIIPIILARGQLDKSDHTVALVLDPSSNKISYYDPQGKKLENETRQWRIDNRLHSSPNNYIDALKKQGMAYSKWKLEDNTETHQAMADANNSGAFFLNFVEAIVSGRPIYTPPKSPPASSNTTNTASTYATSAAQYLGSWAYNKLPQFVQDAAAVSAPYASTVTSKLVDMGSHAYTTFWAGKIPADQIRQTLAKKLELWQELKKSKIYETFYPEMIKETTIAELMPEKLTADVLKQIKKDIPRATSFAIDKYTHENVSAEQYQKKPETAPQLALDRQEETANKLMTALDKLENCHAKEDILELFHQGILSFMMLDILKILTKSNPEFSVINNTKETQNLSFHLDSVEKRATISYNFLCIKNNPLFDEPKYMANIKATLSVDLEDKGKAILNYKFADFDLTA